MRGGAGGRGSVSAGGRRRCLTSLASAVRCPVRLVPRQISAVPRLDRLVPRLDRVARGQPRTSRRVRPGRSAPWSRGLPRNQPEFSVCRMTFARRIGQKSPRRAIAELRATQSEAISCSFSLRAVYLSESGFSFAISAASVSDVYSDIVNYITMNNASSFLSFFRFLPIPAAGKPAFRKTGIKTEGAPSLAFFAKGGTRCSRQSRF